jgi:hypothetical protein
MRREENYMTRRLMNINVEGWRGRGRPKKRWIDCLRQGMREMVVRDEMTSDRREWGICMAIVIITIQNVTLLKLRYEMRIRRTKRYN